MADRHYTKDKDGKVFRKVFNCWKCYAVCKPNSFRIVNGVNIACSYKCTDEACDHISVTRD